MGVKVIAMSYATVLLAVGFVWLTMGAAHPAWRSSTAGRPRRCWTGRPRRATPCSVIGTKGAGASRSVLGSTATELARTAQVPVLMVGTGEEPVTVAELPALRSHSVPGR